MALKSALLSLLIFSTAALSAHAQLSATFYNATCPFLEDVVQNVMENAVRRNPRMGASILRLFFHDCFVNGCDASVLLDSSPLFSSEKNSRKNANSLLGFDVIDEIKSSVEAACGATVSCADILALASRDGVVLLGGPSWPVLLGRRDAMTASADEADADLPPPSDDLPSLIGRFAIKGLSAKDMTALSGAHTVGFAQCANFRDRIYHDSHIDQGFADARKKMCPQVGGDNIPAPLDGGSPITFDNRYYQNLVAGQGLLHSDQELFNSGSQDGQVWIYSTNSAAFFADFAAAMVKMGNINPLIGTQGEIRLNCRRVN